MQQTVQEDMLFAKPLETHTTGEAIFKLINDYFEKHEINWSCLGVCTDDAKSMLTAVFIGKHWHVSVFLQSQSVL